MCEELPWGGAKVAWDVGNVLDIDVGYAYIGLYVHKNSSSCIHNISALYVPYCMY